MVIICKMSLRSEKQMKWDPLYNFQGFFFCKVVKPTPTLVLHVLCFNKTKKRKEIKIRKKEKERKKERKRKKRKKRKGIPVIFSVWGPRSINKGIPCWI